MIKKLLFVFVLASVFVQCEVPVDEEYDLYGDGIDNNNNDDPLFKVTIDGVVFHTSTVVGIIYNTQGMIMITSNQLSQTPKVFGIQVEALSIGNYSLNYLDDGSAPNHAVSYTPNASLGNLYVASPEEEGSTGFINISEIDITNHTISGTFQAHVLDFDGNAINLTNGVFNNVPYTSN